jgi:homoserine kinase
MPTMPRPSFRAAPVRIRVPATSANLGPGFDALGLALGRYDDVVVRIADDGLFVDVAGEGADKLPRTGRHLVVRALRSCFDALGGQPRGLEVVCANRIPQGRGLGSSAAAIVAGVLAARALVLGGEEALDDLALFRLAADLEGHPDNVAACLFGGLTVAWTPGPPAVPADEDPGSGADAGSDAAARAGTGLPGSAGPGAGSGAVGGAGSAVGSGAVRGAGPGAGSGAVGGAGSAAGAGESQAVRLAVSPGLRPVLFVPNSTASTARVRKLLPDLVPHADAARNAGRAALLVHALTSRSVDAGELLAGTQDWLHQPFRAAAMPRTAALVEQLRADGVPAVVSGAGPSVLAFAVGPADLAGYAPRGWVAEEVPVDLDGATVLPLAG